MQPQVFAFGKLPAHGDFVSRGLSAQDRDAWDAWTSEGLAAAEDALGDAFADAHDSAPPWRFVFGPSRFGQGWRAGAFAPSIDGAGRRFLIVLGAAISKPLEPDGEGARLAEVLEEQIYRTFGAADDVDAMVAHAGSALGEVVASEGVGAEGRFWTLGGPQHRPASLTLGAPSADLLKITLSPTELIA